MNSDEREDDDDAAWLLARERGAPAGADPRAVRYAQLGSLIADLPASPAGAQPRAGWKRDVLAAIDAAEADDATVPRGRWRRWATAAAGLAAAAAVILVVARHGDHAERPALAIRFDVAPGSHAHRGSDASVGDTLVVRGALARTGEHPPAGELRIYDAAGGEQARCVAASPSCTIERNAEETTLRLTMLLRAPGALRAVLFAPPRNTPSEGIDVDIETAQRLGVAVTTQELVTVR